MMVMQAAKLARRTFCNWKCSSMAHRERVKGEKNGMWVDGTNRERYLADFNRVKMEARQRDGNACRLCGVKRADYDKELDVHHIDYNKENNVIGNMVSLCRFCHGKMHGGKAARTKWVALWLSALSQSPSPNAFTT